MCQCLPLKLVTTWFQLPGIENELIHTGDRFKVVEEQVTDFVGVPITVGIPLSSYTQQSSWKEIWGDLLKFGTCRFWKFRFISTCCMCGTDRPFGAKCLLSQT